MTSSEVKMKQNLVLLHRVLERLCLPSWYAYIARPAFDEEDV